MKSVYIMTSVWVILFFMGIFLIFVPSIVLDSIGGWLLLGAMGAIVSKCRGKKGECDDLAILAIGTICVIVIMLLIKQQPLGL
jgi:hypothetical protein